SGRGGAGVWRCRACGVEVPEARIFGGTGGAAGPRTCRRGGGPVPAENSFCSKCGTRVATGHAASAPSTTNRSAAPTTATGSTAERRQLTIMFCDMVGSSALSTRLDPEEQGDVIAAFHTCCANEIKTLGGMVAQYLGDGVLAYFGYPTAHENDAERAILAGLAILKAIGTLKTAADVVVKARIAIGSGVVVVGDLMREGVTQENAAIGETTNPVARLQAMGEPGIGKSRLAGALREHLRSAPHTLLTYFCSPLHQGSALYPFIGQLNRAAG